MPLIGDPNRFAVEYELDPENYEGIQLLGRISCLAGGQRIGDGNVLTSLSDALFAIEHVLMLRGRRTNDGLAPLPAKEVFRLIDTGLYVGNNAAIEERGLAEEWARHNVRIATPSFGNWKLFLVEEGDTARLIFGRDSDHAMEQPLVPGEFDEVLEHVRREFNELYLREGGLPA